MNNVKVLYFIAKLSLNINKFKNTSKGKEIWLILIYTFVFLICHLRL